MTIHPRTAIVADARYEICKALNAVVDKYTLTFGEILGILADESATFSRYLVRTERHPDDMEKKGDEA